MSVLPKEINYAAKPSALPAGTTTFSVVAAPSNGSSFSDNGVIFFDLQSRGYLVPGSLYLRYKASFTTVVAAQMKGVPVYTPIQNLSTIIGSQVVENITNYGQLMNMIVNTKLTNSSKAGLSQGLGFGGVGTQFTNDNCNGRLLALNDSFALAGPLSCILSNADNLVPLKYMPSVRLQLTVDTIANIFTTTVVPTVMTLANLELCYDIVEFGPDVDASVMSMADANGKIMIKSQSYLSSGQTIAAASAGSLEFIYNLRLASIKSLFCNFSGTHANSLNKNWDSLDITSGNGDYQFFIGGVPYPPRALSTVNNKAGILMELSGAWGPVHDILSSQFAITPLGFNYTNTATTTYLSPGQFWVGVNTERLSSNSVMLSGTSSQNSPISLRININTATTNAQVAQVIALYDAIIEVSIVDKQVSILQ